jgi:Tfp pilus assembly protein FimT
MTLKRGYTLVEFMIGCVVLCLLMAMSVPAYKKFMYNRTIHYQELQLKRQLTQIRFHRGDNRMDVWHVHDYIIDHDRVKFVDDAGHQWDLPLDRVDFSLLIRVPTPTPNP